MSVGLLLSAMLMQRAQAQGVPAAPAGGGIPAAAGGGGGGSFGGMSYGAIQGSGLAGTYTGATFVPGQIPGTLMNTNTAMPQMPPAGGMGGDSMMSPVAAIANACSAALTAYGNVLQNRALMDDINDAEGFKPDRDIEPRRARSYGSGMNSMWSKDQQGCQHFIDKDGNVGPWGRTAMAEMENHADIYAEKVPSDIGKFCPNFTSSMAKDPKGRKYWWLWFFASLSKPESSCRAGAVNPNAPNGSALGLFQLETAACARVGMSVSKQDLLDPHKNIRCAVKLFAKEMQERNSMFIGHSRGRGGTYWGPLRNDDHNMARGGDRAGNHRMEALLKKFPDCHK